MSTPEPPPRCIDAPDCPDGAEGGRYATPPANPVERLRSAAALIERRAAAATPGPWEPEYAYGDRNRVQAVFVECSDETCNTYDCVDGTHGIGGFDSTADNRWSILLGPQVAAPLAAWLRHPASTFDEHALALADVILRGPR